MDTTLHPRKGTAVALCTLASLAFCVPSSAIEIHVDGRDDADLDRPALQQGLDLAEPGDVLVLSGVFQLDGERLLVRTTPLTLRGVVVDDDGDGRENEDWIDGVDNDGDGQVDEDGWDAVIRGVTNPDGSLARDADPASYFNRGLALQGVQGTAERLSIRHLKFEHHLRAVTLEPEIDAANNLCEESTATGGRAVDVDLRHNFFTDNERATQVFGQVEDLRLHQNLFLGNHAVDLLLIGSFRGCTGAPGFLLLGTPTGARITENRILDSNIGIFTDLTRDLLFRANSIDEVVLGVFTRRDEEITIQGNDISRSLRAVTTSLPATDATITGNRISQVLTVGILLQNQTSGFLVRNNHFDGSGTADVVLAPNTTGNTVIALPGVRVVDQGTANDVIVRGGGSDS